MSDAICSVISIVWSRVSAGAVGDETKDGCSGSSSRIVCQAGGRPRGSSAGRTRRRTSAVRCPDSRGPCVACGQRNGAASECRSDDAATVAECARCPAPPTRSSLSAPGSAGCPRRCTWPAPGARSRWSSRAMFPAGGPACTQESGYTFDTGPTVLTMPDLVESTLAAVGEPLDRWLTLHRLDPAYRARFADGSVIDVRADPDAMAEEIARACGTDDAAGYRCARRVPARAVRGRDAALHRPQSRLAACSWSAHRCAAGGDGRLPATGAEDWHLRRDERLPRIFSFQAMYAGLAPAQALAIYAVITYLDCVAGVYFPEGGMHAVPRRWPARHASTASSSLRHHRRPDRGTTGGRGRDHHRRRAHPGRRRRRQRRPAAAYRRCSAGYTPRRVRRCATRRRACVLHAGSRPPYADTRTTRSTSARRGTHFRKSSTTAAHERPVVPADDTDEDRPVAGAARQARLLRPVPGAEPRPPPSRLGRRSAPVPRRMSRHRGPRIQRLRRRDRARASGDAGHWAAPDWPPVPRSRRRTFSQTGPFRPPTLDRRIENWSSAAANTQPGVGVPMVLMSGRLAAERVTGPPGLPR